jgi:hypothetical protein
MHRVRFLRMMNDVFREFLHKFVIVYLDGSMASVFSAAHLMNTWSAYVWFFSDLKRRVCSYVIKSASSAFMRWSILALLCLLTKFPFR